MIKKRLNPIKVGTHYFFFVSFIFTNTKWSDIFYIEDEEMSALLDEFMKQIEGAK